MAFFDFCYPLPRRDASVTLDLTHKNDPPRYALRNAFANMGLDVLKNSAYKATLLTKYIIIPLGLLNA